MDWLDVGKKIISLGFPLLGGAIGGAPGAGAGRLVASFFGCSDDSPNEVIKALENDSNASEKLREIELSNKTELMRLTIQRESQILDDKENARLREIMLAELNKPNHIPSILAIGTFLFVVALVFVILLLNINTSDFVKELLAIILGVFLAKVGTIYDYYYGSSTDNDYKSKK